jgi:ATP-dependent protease HslVU (ClpYQ) peptidase subunit
VWIGGDSAASNDMSVLIMGTPQVFRHGSVVIGMAGSILAANALRLVEEFPGLPDFEALDRYMTFEFPKAVRKVFKRARVPSEDGYWPSAMIVGIHDRLYEVAEDLSWIVPAGPFVSVGSGSLAANGALDVLVNAGLSVQETIVAALDTASRTTPFVRPPFVLMSTMSGQELVFGLDED